MTPFGDGIGRALVAARPLAEAFGAAGHRLYLVGGIVRDDLAGRVRVDVDYDLTTDARPEQTKALLEPLADAVWALGERFGTIGARVAGQDFEITTHRADSYDGSSRKPTVEFGDDLDDDLARRDFTINAMAVDVADGELVDPFGGAADLVSGTLRTPLDPEISFSDDPLRMLRAARFVAALGLAPDPGMVAAVERMHARMAIVSVERVREELQKTMKLADPQPAFAFLTDTGLLPDVLPAVAAAGLAADRVGARIATAENTIPQRWAALLLDAAPEARRGELARLKPSTDLATEVRWLLGAEPWLTGPIPSTEPELRRLAGTAPAVSSLEARLTFVGALRADRAPVDAVSATLAALRAAEPDLDDPRPPISGDEVAAMFGLEPGPVIGEANRVLREHRFDHGPFDDETARELLRAWWSGRSG